MRPSEILRRGPRTARAPRPRPRSSTARSPAPPPRPPPPTVLTPVSTILRPSRAIHRSIATPPGPATATGRQSATITSGAIPARSVAWPSAAGRSGPGSAYALCSGASSCVATWLQNLAPDHDAIRREPHRLRHPVAVFLTSSRRSPVRIARLRLSCRALTPPTRVVNATLAFAGLPPAIATRLFGAGTHRHPGCQARRHPVRREALPPPRDLAAELAPQGLRERGTDTRSLGDSGCEEILPGDLEPDIAPLGHVAIEPLGAQSAPGSTRSRPSPSTLDRLGGTRGRGRGELARRTEHVPQPPRGARRAACRRRVDREHGVDLALQGRAAPARRRHRSARRSPREARRAPTRRAARSLPGREARQPV